MGRIYRLQRYSRNGEAEVSGSKDPPIEPREYIHGVKVVDIGDIRVARGLSRRPHSVCNHKQLVYDQNERRIWCKDCEKDVEPFDAFAHVVEQYHKAYAYITSRFEELSQAETFQARSLAAREIDKVWRSKKMVPACPHCRQGLFPEDFKNGCSSLSREYAEQMLRFKKGK